MYRYLSSLLVLILIVIPLAAQDDIDAPLIAYFNDDLYRLEGDALVSYEACQPDEEIVGQFTPSPDGTRFLMSTFPKIVTEARAAFGSLGDIPFSPNIWLCDTTTDTLERIIVQPGADEPFADELPALEQVMAAPVWSPDGTQLAWSQLNFDDNSQVLMTLDLATGEIIELLIDVPLAPFPGPPELIAWTEQGILLWVFEFDDETFFNIETLFILDAESGDMAASYEILNGGENDDFYLQRELVQTSDDTTYAIQFDGSGWVLYDLETGAGTPTQGRLAITVPSSEDSLIVEYEIDVSYNYNWQIADSDIEPLNGYTPGRIALSPDGTQLAYADSVLHIVDANGDVIDVINSDGFADDFSARVVWGASTQVFIPLAENEPASLTSCEGAPPIQASVGDTARVIAETIPNRIRSIASTGGDIVGEIPGRGEFTVLGGPVCAEGYTWFQIDYNGISGWTVEGSGESYFIETVLP